MSRIAASRTPADFCSSSRPRRSATPKVLRVAFLFLTYILQSIEHLSPLAAGLGFLPLTVSNGLASTQVASRLLARVPVRAIVVPGLLTGAAGVALFTWITPVSGYAGLVLPAELLAGIGLGLSVMPLFATATKEANPADAGATGAAANMAQQVGASVGTAVLNTVAATPPPPTRPVIMAWPVPRPQATATASPASGPSPCSSWPRSSAERSSPPDPATRGDRSCSRMLITLPEQVPGRR